MVVDTQPTEEAPTAVESDEPAADQRAPAPVPEAVEVAALQAELEQTERRLQQVVDRYETLLAERSRAACGEETVWTDGGENEFVRRDDDGGWLAWLRSLL